MTYTKIAAPAIPLWRCPKCPNANPEPVTVCRFCSTTKFEGVK